MFILDVYICTTTLFVRPVILLTYYGTVIFIE